jgi:AcrR family transcriptional regulator
MTAAPGIDDDTRELSAAQEEELVERALTPDLGQELARRLARMRTSQERWQQRQDPAEGLRERKKRLTRQLISDIATSLFVARGFDEVTVAEVAERAGVSEKTVYNYFPTKESLVFDESDAQIGRLAEALRNRERGESPTKALVAALKADLDRFEALTAEMPPDFLPRFSTMVEASVSLRAAWHELRQTLVDVTREALASSAEVDPQDPEPMIAARALVGLHELSFESAVRHLRAGVTGAALRAAIEADIDRAARLLDTGLWSFNLLAQGSRTREQLRDATRAAEDARKQVIDALKQARLAWRELRRQPHDHLRDHLRDH